jgi:2-polyprenyl-6-methoxyphenol hydroxylase-like FAD-dependent oxidoreductase
VNIDVIVAGGGFAGSVAAYALARSGRRVVVLEGRERDNPSFRGELVHPYGVDLFGALGVLSELWSSGAMPVQGFAVGVRDAGQRAELAYAAMGRHASPGLAMDHAELVRALRVQATGAGAEIRLGARVVDVIKQGSRVAGVRTSDGTEWRAPLTVVAEGRHSRLREALRIDARTVLVSFTAALAVENQELPSPGFAHVFLGGWGPTLAYRISPQRIRMCFDLPPNPPRGRQALSDAVARDATAVLDAPLASAVRASLASRPPELVATHAMYTQRCSAPGAVLIGDAAGCSHPLTASGLMIALSDVKLLLDSIDGTRASDEALRGYERQRYDFVEVREVLAEALYRVFRGERVGMGELRRGVLRYWQTSARARRASLELLAGYESRPSAFIAEYMRVVGQSARGAVHPRVAQRRGLGPLRDLLTGSIGELRAIASRMPARESRSMVLNVLQRVG